jgi:hypothetical protein
MVYTDERYLLYYKITDIYKMYSVAWTAKNTAVLKG